MEEQNYRSFYAWFEQVKRQIRFRPDHKSIKRELESHYNDHYHDLRRLGYDKGLAEKRAVRSLGDPVAIGKALDAAHKPWLGWLWLVSKYLSVVVLSALVLVACWEDSTGTSALEWLLEGDSGEHWGGNYYHMPGYFWDRTENVPGDMIELQAKRVATGKGRATVKRAGYTFRIPYAEVWEAVLDDGTAYNWIYVAVESEDKRFWDDGLEHLYKGLTLSDASGRYCNSYYYDELVGYDEDGHVIWGPADGYLKMALAESGVFHCTYYLSARMSGEAGAYGEQLELAYDYGEPWSIVIDLKEVADA